ncbi:MAG: hypothetical protein R3A44_21135 [Caldilineaceae bacterium]
MADLDTIVHEHKKLSAALKKDYGAKGDKLGDVVKNAQNLPSGAVDELNRLAGIIDGALYGAKSEDEYLADPKKFVADCTKVLAALRKKPPQKTETPGVLVFLIILIIILFMFHNL